MSNTRGTRALFDAEVRPTFDEGLTIKEAVEEFILTCEAKGLTAHTIRVYRYALAQMRAFCEARGLTYVVQLTTTLIKQYLEAIS